MGTNLPKITVEDSAQATKSFFDSYGVEQLEFPANDVEATISFFLAKGFDRDASELTAFTVLKQAKLDNVPIFQLLETLGQLDSLQISAIIAEILNNNRPASSTLGFRVPINQNDPQIRNVAA